MSHFKSDRYILCIFIHYTDYWVEIRKAFVKNYFQCSRPTLYLYVLEDVFEDALTEWNFLDTADIEKVVRPSVFLSVLSSYLVVQILCHRFHICIQFFRPFSWEDMAGLYDLDFPPPERNKLYYNLKKCEELLFEV